MNSSSQQTPIAIIGMAGIFPEAANLQEYWENILQKRDCITEVPPSRWSPDDYYDPDPAAPDKTYSKRGGFIPEIDFDPLEFGLPPNSLEVTDVSQLLALAVAKAAMMDAGYGAAPEDVRERTGVILGIGGGQKLITPLTSRLQYPVWEKVLRSSGLSATDTATIIEKIKLGYVEWNENSFPGMLGNVIAGRVANRLDLGGVNCVVDAACASSLSALQMAVSELTACRADMMITGGVDTDNSPFMYMSFSKTPALSKTGQTRPFDADSDGMMLGEGIGMLVLKRLADAERDGDLIYAVVKGIGAASDGRYKSIYAPRASGQERALRRAYAAAGFAPASVGLLEAHGTGTMAGDPVELSALQQVFDEEQARDGNAPPTIALGSVKSQIGHTKSAAGVASLLKTVLALHHKILPPTINVTTPNPALVGRATSLYLNTETRPWLMTTAQTVRRAGVSSFGFGGTNFHVALEEYQADHEEAYRLHSVPQLILLSAATPAQLRTTCQQWLDRLTAEDAPAHFAALVTQSNHCLPVPTDARVGFTATSAGEAVERMQLAVERLTTIGDVAWEHPKGIYYRPDAPQTGTSATAAGKVVALFSGQGSQSVGMGRTLTLNFPEMRSAYAKMDRRLMADGLQPLSSVVFPPPTFTKEGQAQQAEQLQRTEYAQPAIGLLSFSLYQLLQRAGLQPDFVAGHSFGELTALWAAGVLTDDSYFALIKTRGQAMAAPAEPGFDPGAMLAVQANWEEVTALTSGVPDLVCANINSPRQIVLAGPSSAIALAEERLAQQEIIVRRLPVSAAFHTPLVDHALQPFTQAVRATPFQPAQLPVYANSTGEPYPTESDAMHQTLAAQISKPVLFQQTIENIYAAGGRIFVEIGPKSILTNLVKEILHDRPHMALAVNANARGDSDRQLREAVVQLRVAGLALGNFDRYQVERPQRETAGKFIVQLNGANYVSEGTRRTFATALADDFQVSMPEKAAPAQVATSPTPGPMPRIDPPALQSGNNIHNGTFNPQDRANPQGRDNPQDRDNPQGRDNPQDKGNSQVTEPVDPQEMATPHHPTGQAASALLAQFYTLQHELLQTHQHYLDHHIEESSAFFRLIEQQQQILQQLGPAALDGTMLAESMARFQAHQTETLRVHEQYLNHQLRYLELLFQQMQPLQTPGNRSAPLPLHAQSPTNGHAMPTAPSQAAPYRAPTSQPTNGQPVRHVPMPATAPVMPIPVTRPKPTGAPGTEHHGRASEAQGTLPPAPPTGPISAVARESNAVASQFVAVVSEKTGYPAELLELEMDMEADLGIDSIKRVEILGVMQEQIPNLPTLRAAELADLRTLQEVVDYVQQQMAQSQPTPQAAQPQSTRPAPPPTGPATPIAVGAIAAQFVSVVSEKTGYPAGLLELEMDMEADLGIDSIKRVEILGVMQEQIPDLPTLRAAELAELRTLQEVVDHVQHQLTHGQSASQANGQVEAIHPPPTNDAAPSSPTVGLAAAQHPTIQTCSVALKSLPAPDRLERTLPDGHCCLVTDSGDDLTTHLVEQLLAQGWVVAVLSFPAAVVPPTAAFPPQVAHFQLADLGEATLVDQLQEITAHCGPIAALFHLDPDWRQLASPSPGHAHGLLPAAEAVVQQIFLLAKHLGPTFERAAAAGSASLMSVTRLDGKLGVGAQGQPYSAVSGGLSGLVKALNHEWSAVFCRAVDLDPTLSASAAATQVMHELYDPNRTVTEVGYGAGERVTLDTADPVAHADAVPPAGNQIYLVSGGARGVTAQSVIALAQQIKGTFILLGRTTQAAEPDWAHGVEDEMALKHKVAAHIQALGKKPTPRMITEQVQAIFARREIATTLQAIQAAGSQVDYFSVDVSKEPDVQQMIATVQARWGPITGIIHGAGVVADKRIEQKTVADFERVYRVKVTGLQNLLAAVDPEQLQAIVLFSSAAGFYGNAGQSDYALANEVLNKMAHLLAHQLPACRVRAINWGPWDGGMVTPALKAHFAQQQINVIPLELGAQLMVQQLCAPRSKVGNTAGNLVQTVVGDAFAPPPPAADAPLRTLRIRRTLREQANPFLRDHRIGGHAVLPIACAHAWIVHTCEQCYPGFTFFHSQHLKVLKGIVFDESFTETYVLDLQEVEKTPDLIRLEAMLSSDTQPGLPRYHYSLVCEVRRAIPAPPAVQPQLDLTNSVSAQPHYADGTLFHGPMFQGLQQIVTLDERQIVLACRLPTLTTAQQGQFPAQTVNPYTADSLFQGLLIWVRHHYQAGSLPLQVDSCTHYQPVDFEQLFYVEIEIVAHNAQRAVANATIYSEQGELCCQIEGAAVTISHELNPLFEGGA